MHMPKEIMDEADKQSSRSTISKYESLDYSRQENYEKLCAEYREAIANKQQDLANRLYELMRYVQKKRVSKLTFKSIPTRRSFWKYVKRIGYKGISSAEGASRHLSISLDESNKLINDAVEARLIYKDGPTTYRIRNPKKINGNDVRAFLGCEKIKEQIPASVTNQPKSFRKKYEENYYKLLAASGKSSDEIQKGIDKANSARELLVAKNKATKIASKRSGKKTNWKNDARKMQNQKPTSHYSSRHGSTSFKKESIDPDDKDKNKKRKLQLGATKKFLEFYGLDG